MSENQVIDPPDYYVQLNTADISSTPKPEAVFPLLGVHENTGPGHRHFHLAIMI
jgi:hypothetical protein